MHKIETLGTKMSATTTDYSDSFNQFVYDEIPPNSHCLDVGCSTGNLGFALKTSKGCSVNGIESNPEAAAVARNRGYDQVFVLDLNNELTALPSNDQEYDVITCADVLEHLVTPEKVLGHLCRLLRPGGMVVTSLPNVAFALTRLHLLLGNWEYQKYGILDRTHLRFYTIKSGRQMIASTGLQITAVKPYNQFGALRYLNPLDKWFPTLLAYQFLVVAKRVEN